MALSDIKTEIKTEIAAVTGIAAANVHTWMRHTPDWNKIYEYYKVGGDDGASAIINAWIIELENTTGEWKDVQASRIYRDYSFIIWGVYSMVDDLATATTFEDLVESVLNELSKYDNITLSDNAHSSDPAILLENENCPFTREQLTALNELPNGKEGFGRMNEVLTEEQNALLQKIFNR